mmetsp:Transcript_6649/g.10987  ORF Transcript_6649/g.10987 Transcript_6649/m.10987 type:complete len:210 (-) Transcript_6649:220-849(-)|eukprot:jgi/Bigna1/52404/estExt_Genewise1Plus.C_80003
MSGVVAARPNFNVVILAMMTTVLAVGEASVVTNGGRRTAICRGMLNSDARSHLPRSLRRRGAELGTHVKSHNNILGEVGNRWPTNSGTMTSSIPHHRDTEFGSPRPFGAGRMSSFRVFGKKKKAPVTNKPREAPKVKENENVITVEGQVVDALPSTMFKVKLDEVDQTVLCQLAGKMRKNNIRVLIGDRVRVELSPYDLSKGRISFRFR